MKAFKVELLILDFDRVGGEGIKEIIENQKYPNRCIRPKVKSIEEREIGDWSDGHFLNHESTEDAAYRRIFHLL